MSHIHPVEDMDKNHFVIDPITRVINNETPKTILVKNDHNSECFTFEIPRIIEGHDMTTCNRIEVHYINIGQGRERNEGIYEVKDFKLDPNDDQRCIGSWLISNNATMYAGTLNFAIRFACVNDYVVNYALNTSIHTGITVVNSVYNSDLLVDEEVVDILQQWFDELENKVNALEPVGISDTVTGDSIIDGDKTKTNISVNKTDGTSTSFVVTAQNGADGAGVIGAKINEDGELVMYMSKIDNPYFITEDGYLAIDVEE